RRARRGAGAEACAPGSAFAGMLLASPQNGAAPAFGPERLTGSSGGPARRANPEGTATLLTRHGAEKHRGANEWSPRQLSRRKDGTSSTSSETSKRSPAATRS